MNHNVVYAVIVSSMKRMVSLVGTSQDSQDLRQQLYVIDSMIDFYCNIVLTVNLNMLQAKNSTVHSTAC